MLDLNNNGIPDYKEPLVWKWFGSFVSTVIMTFAAPHTIAYRAADAYQNAMKGQP